MLQQGSIFLLVFIKDIEMKKRVLSIRVFNSFEEESKTEYNRRANQSSKERMREFAVLQERCWGKKWTQNRLEPVVTFEEVAW